MILIRNKDWGGFDMTVVYDPDWDGPIERWENDPAWEVIYEDENTID